MPPMIHFFYPFSLKAVDIQARSAFRDGEGNTGASKRDVGDGCIFQLL